VHANGGVYGQAAPTMGNRAGMLLRFGGRADRRRADAVPAAACRQPKTEGRARIIACLKELN